MAELVETLEGLLDPAGVPLVAEIVDFTGRSSWLRGAEYSLGTLIVYLDDGNVLQYVGISPSLWERFKVANSPGAFYRREIRLS
jgi:hypothetical protein